MKVEEMALRSEIRQMLNEAGFNREAIKQLVKESIDDVVKNQVNQVLMERKEKDLAEVVSDYLDNRMYRLIQNSTESVVRDKLRWMTLAVNVQVNNKADKAENEDVKPKTGKWIKTDDVDEIYGTLYKCSVCGLLEVCGKDDDYCPNCGAKMEVSE